MSGISDRSAFSQITGTLSGYLALIRSASDLRFSVEDNYRQESNCNQTGEIFSTTDEWSLDYSTRFSPSGCSSLKGLLMALLVRFKLKESWKALPSTVLS
mmetsp:Transcript_8138/g.16569  ORF Transcript_8138/g.16569 Transcript_8138/m.16569 type:complete len:100 (+) Transcript_8138:466-765(+)